MVGTIGGMRHWSAARMMRFIRRLNRGFLGPDVAFDAVVISKWFQMTSENGYAEQTTFAILCSFEVKLI